MNKGFIHTRLAAALIVLFSIGFVGWAIAQVAPEIASDPCSLYPHQSANIPVGTPTAKLVAGVLGKQIYVCAVHLDAPAGTPGFAANAVTFSYGEVVSATPCATATPGATLGILGVGDHGGGQTTMLGPVPAAAGTPVVDLCGLVAGGNSIQGGTLEYVQVKP